MLEKEKWDAIVIGFGKGGKTLAMELGRAGKRTVLIEKSADMYGGTCINVGCIPTKFLMEKSKNAISLEGFSKKQTYYSQAIKEELELVKNLRLKNLSKLENTPNVTVITGTAKLLSATQVEVRMADGVQFLEGKQIFLNTGSQPIIPAVEGIKDNPCVVTSEKLLRQTVLPKKLIIIGGGYIGVEFASMYADFGSEVTVIQHGAVFLPREDREIAEAVLEHFQKRGVKVLVNTKIEFLQQSEGKTLVKARKDGVSYDLEGDTVLIATGRKANVEGLGLENADVEITSSGGVMTDEHLRTTASNIYAMGDVVGGLQFTYISLDDFRIVRSAVLGDGEYTLKNRGGIPYSVFLNPPFSRVGMSEKEALDQGYDVKVFRMPAAAIPKALVLKEPEGLLKAVVDEKTGRILGAHLFCAQSHEMINTVKVVMDADLPYTVLRDMIFTHPTMSEAFNELFNA